MNKEEKLYPIGTKFWVCYLYDPSESYERSQEAMLIESLDNENHIDVIQLTDYYAGYIDGSVIKQFNDKNELTYNHLKQNLEKHCYGKIVEFRILEDEPLPENKSIEEIEKSPTNTKNRKKEGLCFIGAKIRVYYYCHDKIEVYEAILKLLEQDGKQSQLVQYNGAHKGEIMGEISSEFAPSGGPISTSFLFKEINRIHNEQLIALEIIAY